MIEMFVTTADAYMMYWHTPIASILSPLLPRWAFLLPEYLFLTTTSFAAVNAALMIKHGQTVWGHFDGDNSPVSSTFKIAALFVLLPIMAIALWQSGRWNDQDAASAVFLSWVTFMFAIVFTLNAIAG